MGSFKEAVGRAALFCLLLAAGPGACDRRAASDLPAPAPAPAPKPDEGYVSSPTVTAARVEGDKIVLDGRAEKNAQVRLATPQGQEQVAQADDQGRWRILVPTAAQPRIFGLSMKSEGRRIQAQGYVLLGAHGSVTLLRAGAGALKLSASGKPRITTFDYDRAGGAVVSGMATPEAVLQVRGDGVPLGDGRADREGRFSIPITRPLAPGQHRLQVVGKGLNLTATVELSPADALTAAPFRGRQTPLGLRADWMTPGGGVQTTLILN